MRVFALELVFAAAVEEVRDVRVLLGLGEPQLAQAGARRRFRRTCRTAAADRRAPGWDTFSSYFVIVAKNGLSIALRRKDAEAVVEIDRRAGVEGRRELTRAIGAEVEEDEGVAVLDRTRLADDRRQHELVVLAARVGVAHRGDARIAARDDRRVRWPAGRRPAACAPSAGRGPSRSSARSRSRSQPARPDGGELRFELLDVALSAERGGVSRPSRKQWIAIGTPAATAASIKREEMHRSSCGPCRRRASP